MRDIRLEKLAALLVRYSVGVKKGDLVLISGAAESAPLALQVYSEVLRAGGNPWMRLQPDECLELFLKHGRPEQLLYVNPIDKFVYGEIDVQIVISADVNPRALTNVDPTKQQLRSKGRRPLMAMAMKRSARPHGDPDRLRWVLAGFPTLGSAQDAEMSLREYEDFVFAAGKLEKPDPVAAWKKLGVAQRRLCDFLNKCRELRFRAPGGTDLRVGVQGRRWINCAGQENFPDGEVFTGPLENATEGAVHYNWPAVYGGREVSDVRLTFKAGRVVDASASKNEEYLLKMIDQDSGGRVLGEIALGTNYDIRRFTRNTLYDEKIGGTFHAALGASYPETGGRNASGLHWDMVCDLRQGGTIEADGKVISRNGKFVNAGWPR